MCSCAQGNLPIPQPIIEEPCNYTLEMVIDWKNILFCVRDNGLIVQTNITTQKFNSYMGILLSCINSNSACFFKTNLDEIQVYINNLITLDICQTI